MNNETSHKYFVLDGKKERLHAPSMATDLIAAMNKMDSRGGWRVVQIPERHYLNPIEIGRNNRFTIKIECSYPNAMRGQASLKMGVRPRYTHQLPTPPKCSFDPKRSIEKIARDILRKIDAKGSEISDAWEGRMTEEKQKDREWKTQISRIESVLGKKLNHNGSSTHHFDVGPLRCAIDERGNMRVERSYLSEDQLLDLIQLFKSKEPQTESFYR